jgi:hypothetical protein
LLGLQHCHDGALVAGLGAKSLQNEHLMNKHRSESFNRSTVSLGHPFATLPLTNMFSINQHTTTLSKALLTAGLLGGAAVATLGAGSALAVNRLDCSFGASTAHTKCVDVFVPGFLGWVLEDKKLTNLDLSLTAPASGDFSFIYDDFGAPGLSLDDEWTTLAIFEPSLNDPTTGSYSYDLEIIEPWKSQGLTFKDVELDTDHAGSGQTVTKVVKDALGTTIATLVSVNGMPDGPDPLSGTFISVTDSWNLDPNTGTIMAISNTYTQTPAPLPILGAGVAFGSIRKLRKFSSRLKTFSMG